MFKKYLLKETLTTTFLLFLFTLSVTSQPSRSLPKSELTRCGTDQYRQQRYQQDPELQRSFNERQTQFLAEVSARIACDGTSDVAVPLAFHFTNDFDCSNEACMLQEIYDQIDILNAAFVDVTSSPNAANCSAAYTAISTGTCISFYLAEPPTCADANTTACNAAVTIGEFNNGGYANSGASSGAGACWDDYLNVFIVSASGGLLGVSDQIPDDLPPDGPGEGVTVGAPYFGGLGGGCNPFDTDTQFSQGKTLIHEIGHYLGLFHTFQGGCGDEPNNTFGMTNITVNDTPAQSAPTQNVCPTGCVASGCGGNKQTANIMDYTDDPCMDMFSEDQAVAMNVVANGLFGSLSIPAAAANLTDLLGLCPAGACALICPTQVITPIATVEDFCSESVDLTLSESGVVIDETSDAVYSWSTGDYLSNGGTAVASTTVMSFTTPDCMITTQVYFLNVDCGTTPLATTLDGGTYTINVYPGPPADLSTLVTVTGENMCGEPIVTPIPGCANYITVTPDAANPTFPVNSGDVGTASYTISFTPDVNSPDCCSTDTVGELVVNGDYESGIPPWTEIEEVPAGTPNPDPFGIIGVSGDFLNGTPDAWFGGWGSLTGVESVVSSYLALTQMINIPTSCTTITLTFDYGVACNGNTSIDFKVFVGGVEVAMLQCFDQTGNFTFDTYTVELTALGVPTGMQTLLIEGTEIDPNPADNTDAASVLIDNVSIDASDCQSTDCDLEISSAYDCQACPTCYTNLTHGGACDLQTLETGAVDYESSDWISTSLSTVIQTGAQIDYDAVDYIEINSTQDHEFEVELGATFHMFIDGCGGAQLQTSPIQNK